LVSELREEDILKVILNRRMRRVVGIRGELVKGKKRKIMRVAP